MTQKFFLALALLLTSNLFAAHREFPKNYDEYPAQEKQDFLYNLLLDNKYEELPELGTKIDQIIARLKANTKTILNTVGSVAKMRFESHSKVYSGIYASGALGVIRFALSADFETTIELKFLIDESPSLDLTLQAHPNTCDQRSALFTNEFISLPIRRNANYFLYLHNEEAQYQVSNLALRSPNGRLVFDVKLPYQLTLIPSCGLKYLMQDSNKTNFREILTTLNKGALLFEVWTKIDVDDYASHIGSIVLDSEFIASVAGDQHLFR